MCTHPLDVYEQAKLTQIVKFSTYKTATLDLLLTNCPTFVVTCEPSPGFSEHDTSILAQHHLSSTKNKTSTMEDKLLEQSRYRLSKNWSKKYGMNNIIRTETIETNLWNKFKNVKLIAQKHHTPTKITSKRFSQPWLNQECKWAVQKKVRQYWVFKQTKKQEEAARNARSTCNNAYNTYVKQNFTENDDSKKTKKLYSFIKAKRSDIVGVSPLVDSEGVTHINEMKWNEMKYNLFNKIYNNFR